MLNQVIEFHCDEPGCDEKFVEQFSIGEGNRPLIPSLPMDWERHEFGGGPTLILCRRHAKLHAYRLLWSSYRLGADAWQTMKLFLVDKKGNPKN